MLFVAHYITDCNHTSYFLNEPTNPSELWALQTSDSVSTNIPNNGLQSCEVLPNSSWYLGCNGTRVKSPLYQRKMNDLFALINHFGDVVFNYVSLEVRKCLLYRYVRTGEVRNHHEKVDGSILVYSQSKKKKRNKQKKW